MPRIRTIKPEFQQSNSMGRVSREARLTFILLWPQCDDSGRVRANSRMLASALFPYDEDAPGLIDGWLLELENDGCIVRYDVGNEKYLAITAWTHQKIDHPTPSKLPTPPDKKPRKTKASSREEIAKPRELSPKPRAVSSTVSSTVPDRTKDQGPPVEIAASAAQLPGLVEIIPPSKPNLEALDIPEFMDRRRGTRWPDEREVPAEWFGPIADRFRELGRAPPDMRLEAAKFAAYWSSLSGAKATKTDWRKTFLNWCLNARTDQRSGLSKPGFDALREGARRAAGLDGRSGEGMESRPDDLLRLAGSAGS